VSRCLRTAVALSVALASAPAALGQLLAEGPNTIGYPTVADALEALRLNRGIVYTIENGWLVATDEAACTIWSFAPAYPAVVKRQVIPRGKASVIEMNVLCEASRPACDALIRTFAEMNGLTLGR
jgi:hypothetical protein